MENTILSGRLALANDCDLSDFVLFVIQHVLDDLVPLVRAFISLGATAEHIWVIGIPYSSIGAVGSELQSMGVQTRMPRIFPFEGVITEALLEATKCARRADKRIIVLEDGGYTLSLAAQLQDAKRIPEGLFAGAVEQTTRGARMDRQLEKAGLLPCPVVSVPDCATKSLVEPPYIAEAVYRNLSDILDKVHPDEGMGAIKKACVIGYGAIGKRMSSQLRSAGVEVFVNDAMPDRSYSARTDGFSDYRDGLRECDLILGATGSTSIGAPILQQLKSNAIVGSCSSRQIEIDIEWIEAKAMKDTKSSHVGPAMMGLSAARTYHYVQEGTAKDLRVIYDGYPMNFWGSSLPDYVGDAILSLLFEGVAAVARQRLSQPLVYRGGEILQDADLEVSMRFRALKPDDGF